MLRLGKARRSPEFNGTDWTPWNWLRLTWLREPSAFLKKVAVGAAATWWTTFWGTAAVWRMWAALFVTTVGLVLNLWTAKLLAGTVLTTVGWALTTVGCLTSMTPELSAAGASSRVVVATAGPAMGMAGGPASPVLRKKLSNIYLSERECQIELMFWNGPYFWRMITFS